MQELSIFSIVLAVLLVIGAAAIIALWRAHRGAQEARRRLAERLFALETQPAQDLDRDRDQRQALERVVGGLAHDLNSALSVVIMNLDVMQQDRALTERHERRLENMMKAMQSGTKLTRHLLNLSHRHKPEMEIVCLAELMPSLVGLLQSALGKQVEISTDVAEDLWQTELDASGFEVMAIHLAVATAGKVTSPDRLTIELRNLAPEEAQRQKIARREHVVLRMACTGIGSAAEGGDGEDFSAHAADAASGFSAVERFAARCGGYLQVERDPQSGTRAALYLPRCRETTEV